MYQGYLRSKAKGNTDFVTVQEPDPNGNPHDVLKHRQRRYDPIDGVLEGAGEGSYVKRINLKGLKAAKRELERDLADVTAMIEDVEAHIAAQ